MKKIFTLITILLLIMSLSFMANSSEIETDAVYSGWYLAPDEGVGLRIKSLLYDGSQSGFPVNALNSENQEVAASMNENDTLAFFTPETFPDWENSSDTLNMTLRFEGGVGDLHADFPYELPSVTDPNTVQLDGPPSMLWPVIPIGDESYYTGLASEFEANSYSITENVEYFAVSFTNTSYSATTTFEKSTGLLYNYTYNGVVGDDQGNPIPLEMTLERHFVLSPSNSVGDTFFSTNPTMAYEVTHAKTSSSTGFDVDYLINGTQDDNILSGHGMISTGDLITVNFDEITESFEEGFGYIFGLQDQTSDANLQLNITINLPENNPGENNNYIYPMFPMVDPALIDGYVKMTDVANGLYDWSIANNMFEISYQSTELKVNARWSTIDGVLDYYFINDSTAEVLLGLDLIASEDLNGLELAYGVSAGDSVFLQAAQIDFDGTDKIDLEEGTGFIQQGDTLNFTVTTASFDDGPTLIVDLVGPNGEESNINFEQTYPGVLSMDGPPLFSPFYLIGNADFLVWMEQMYSHSGATFDSSSENVTLEWVENYEDGSLLELSISYEKSTGIINSYFVSFESNGADPSFLVEFIRVSEPSSNNGDNAADDTSSPGVPFSSIGLIFGVFIATYMTRRKFQ